MRGSGALHQFHFEVPCCPFLFISVPNANMTAVKVLLTCCHQGHFVNILQTAQEKKPQDKPREQYGQHHR
jgi:hypothetical protein